MRITGESKLVKAIGRAIEDYARKNTMTHHDILRALEALRWEFTEDFIKQHPNLIWTLHRQ